jgi:hypothetical protein
VRQYRAIDIPEDIQPDFPRGRLCLEFFVGRRQQLVPLHRLCLTLCFITVNPGHISCHNSVQKSMSFTSMKSQMLLTNHLPCTFLITGQLSWNPSATHLPITDIIMDSIVCWAVTPVQIYGDLINVDLTTITVSPLDLLFYCLSCHANWSPNWVFITAVFLPLWNLSTHSYTLPWIKQNVSVQNLYSSVDFRFLTLWPQKCIRLCCFSKVQFESGTNILYELLRKLIILDCHDPYKAYC